MKALYLSKFMIIFFFFFTLTIIWETITGIEGIPAFICKIVLSMLAVLSLKSTFWRLLDIANKEIESRNAKIHDIEKDEKHDI